MFKYVIVDIRIIAEYVNKIAEILNIKNQNQINMLLPVLLCKLDDYRVDCYIWDVLGQVMSAKEFDNLDCEVVSFLFENISDLIRCNLNERFNMSDTVYYSFEDWIGSDPRFEVHFE